MSYNLWQVHDIGDSQQKVHRLLPPTSSQKGGKSCLFRIPNCVNPVAWLHEAVLGKEDSVLGISPRPGGLHLTPYPHDGAWSCCKTSAHGLSQLPPGFDLPSIYLDSVCVFVYVSEVSTWPTKQSWIFIRLDRVNDGLHVFCLCFAVVVSLLLQN